MNLNFKKMEIKTESDRIKALENIRILEDTTAAHIAAVNRLLYVSKKN